MTALDDLIAAKEAAEGTGDLDAIMATFSPNPRFEFFPVARALRGQDAVRQFYAHLLDVFMPKVQSFEIVERWRNDTGIAMDETVSVVMDDGQVESFNILVLIGIDDGRLWGERIYGDERFFELMVGEQLRSSEQSATR